MALGPLDGDREHYDVQIGPEEIRKGLDLFAASEQYRHHWHDMIQENDDAITADVFMQLSSTVKSSMAKPSDPQAELDEIYVSIGEGAECTDELLQRIQELENIINPPTPIGPIVEEDNHEPVCGNPYCNGWQCWECAAIRGGDPMDA